jgi:hypothetical protein
MPDLETRGSRHPSQDRCHGSLLNPVTFAARSRLFPCSNSLEPRKKGKSTCPAPDAIDDPGFLPTKSRKQYLNGNIKNDKSTNSRYCHCNRIVKTKERKVNQSETPCGGGEVQILHVRIKQVISIYRPNNPSNQQ